MQDLKEAINNILDEELVKAKEIIHTNLYAKMGALLEQTLLDYAPTVLDEKSLSPKQKEIARLAGDPKEIDAEDLASLRGRKQMQEKYCEDGDCEDDDEDKKKKKMKKDDDEEDKEDDKEDDDSEEMNEAFAEFTEYLSQLIEEIEEETGEELSEEEILEIADIVLNEDFDYEDEQQ